MRPDDKARPSPPVRSDGPFGPLGPEQIAELDRARRRGRKLRSAARVASFSGWTTLLFGVLALPFGLTSGVALALGLALVAIGYHELALRTQLLRVDRGAPRALALNQLLLGAVICAYGGFMLATQGNGGAFSSALASDPAVASEPALAGMVDSVRGLERMLIWGIYGGLIAGTIVAQGLTARYYAARSRVLGDYLAETPGWVIDLQKRGLLG